MASSSAAAAPTRDACLHAASEVAESSPVQAAVRYPHVRPELGLRPSKGSGGAVGELKCVRHDADHREFTPFDHRATLNRVPSIPAQGYGAANRGRIAMELAVPQRGAQHYDRRRIFCRERPADERPNAEQRKELSIRDDRHHSLRSVGRFEQPGRQFVSREPLKRHTLGAERL